MLLGRLYLFSLSALVLITTFAENRSFATVLHNDCPWRMTLPFYMASNYSDTERSAKKQAFVEYVNSNNNGEHSELKGIKAELLPEFDTIIQYPISGLHNPDAKISIALIHGNGAQYSNSDTMRPYIKYFGDTSRLTPNPLFSAKSLTSRIQLEPNFIQADVAAIDGPQHRFGADGDHIDSPEKVGDYYAAFLKWYKMKTGNPLLVLTRSSGAALFIDVVKKHPDLIDGFIFTSPTMPGEANMKKSLADFHDHAAKSEGRDKLVVDHRAINWIANILSKVSWDENSIRDIPTLILTGSNDWEVKPNERDFYEELSVLNPYDIRYIDIPNAEHDLVRETSNKKYRDRDILPVLRLMVEHQNRVLQKASSRKKAP